MFKEIIDATSAGKVKLRNKEVQFAMQAKLFGTKCHVVKNRLRCR